MDELMNDKIEETRKGQHVEGMDLMGQLVRSSYGVSKDQKGSAKELTEGANKGVLTYDEIVGNAFIMLIAGHETTANTIHFTLINLAANPASQRRLQRDIDEILGDSDPETWDYESLVNPMMGSMLGACMNETLRTVPAVAEIPKVTVNQDQTITQDGRKYVVPSGTAISLAVVSVHRNPRYWPTRPSKIRPGQDDLDDYVPERWLRTSLGKGRSEGGGSMEQKEATTAEDNEEDFGGFRGPDTSAQLFRPERGASMPFSDGARACLGRRIAQVEIIAALAVLFRGHSVELAVDDELQAGGGDAEVDAMGREERARLYARAQRRSREVVAGATTRLTLKLHGESHVPVRLVRRGEERFVSWIDG